MMTKMMALDSECSYSTIYALLLNISQDDTGNYFLQSSQSGGCRFGVPETGDIASNRVPEEPRIRGDRLPNKAHEGLLGPTRLH